MGSSDDTQATHTPTNSGIRSPNTTIPPAFGRYRVRRLLGQGGVGAVFEADDPDVGRRVALKVLREDRDSDRESLRREAQALGRLVHPNVVSVYDVGVEGDQIYLVMQLVDGVPLDRYLAARTLAPRAIVALCAQAGRGLAAAHAAGLVHCDVKPGNVLVDRDGIARVSDFGLARGGDGDVRVAGTPAYMAPEQFAGAATPASDQFAFCVMVWELLAGERPFADSEMFEPEAALAMAAIARRGPRRSWPKVARTPAHVAHALERGLAERPDDRFASMTALLDAFERPSRRRWWLVGAAIVAAGGAAAAIALARGDDTAPARPAWNGADVAAARTLPSDGCDENPIVDGDRVIFDRTRGDDVDLYSQALAGGAARQLTSAPTWEWRPNTGRRPGEIVYLIHQTREVTDATIGYLDLATGKTTVAASLFALDAVAIGDALVYSPAEPPGLRRRVGVRDVAFIDPPASHAYYLVAASPRGDRIATTRTSVNDGPTHPCVVDLATRETRCLPTRSNDARPAFSADGTALYFSARDGLRRRDLATGDEAVIASGVTADGGLAVTRDGSALVYSRCRGRYELIDAATRAVVVAGPDVWAATLGPDGAIAWTRDVRGIYVLALRKRDGVETDLTDDVFGSARGPTFSPDGTLVAFAASDPNPGIHTVRVAMPGAPHRLTDDPSDRDPVWLPSGLVAFTREVGSSHAVFAVASSGGAPRRLIASTRFAYGNRGDELLVDTGDDDETSLRWLDPATGAERPGPPRPPGFVKLAETSPHGRWAAFARGPNGRELFRLRLDGGTLELVRTLGAGETASSIAIDDDGRVLVVTATWPAAGLVVVPAKPGARF